MKPIFVIEIIANETLNCPMTRAHSRRQTSFVNPAQFALFDFTGALLATEIRQPKHVQDVIPLADVFNTTPPLPEPIRQLFRITADTVIAPKGQAAKLRANLTAIETLKRIVVNSTGQQHSPTANEQERLIQYTGWGSLSQLWNVEAFTAWQNAQQTNHHDSKPALTPEVDRWISQFGKYRQQLEDLLTPDERAEAAASTLNAFYTTSEVITAIWQAVMGFGFTGGRILEPAAGIGHFFGLMPECIAQQSELVAVEKDLISGQILQLLYPSVETHLTGFEQCQFDTGSFDLVIGNVPFGSYSLYDRHNTDLSTLPIHNYFIGRAARLVRPGGLVALVTSAGTLDAQSETFRRWLATEGQMELAGAIRLPSNAFEANAGTVVTTDILFLVKRGGIGRRFTNHAFERTITLRSEKIETEPETNQSESPQVRTLAVNEYYHTRPGMMLGQMHFADEVNKGGLYRADQPTLYHSYPDELPGQLTEVVNQLPTGIIGESTASPTKSPKEERLAKFTGEVRAKGRTYNQRTVINQYESLKEGYQQVLAAEKNGKSDLVIDPLRQELNSRYTLFLRHFGTLNRNRAITFLEEWDKQFATIQALEIVKREKEGVTISTADIFRQRVYPHHVRPQTVDNLGDGVRLSVALYGWIELTRIADWTDKSEAAVERDLVQQELAYRNPSNGRLEDRDSYLSGHVRRKLAAAERAAQTDSRFVVNQRALSAIVPPTVPAALIQFRLGSVWIPTRIIQAFIWQTLHTEGVTVRYNSRAGQYELAGAEGVASVQNRSLGTDRRTAMQLIEAALQQRSVIITKTVLDAEGKERQVKDVEATSQAVQAQEQLNELFIDFVREYHSAEIEPVYNELYNSYVHKAFREPAFTHYPGASTDIQLRFHQFRAVERIKEQDTLLAHAVGSGKTYTMITAAMELKRLGLAHKPLIAVQNSTLEDFARSWRRLYPSAVIYVPQPADMEASNRKRFLQRIATNNFDGVLISQSFLKLIPDDPASEEAFIRDEIERVEYAVAMAERKGQKKPMTVKRLNELKLRLTAKRLRQADRQKDQMLTFDQLGIDALFLDEAHKYKRLGFFTQRQNVKGIDTAGSEDALSAMFKCRSVQARQGRVVLATGTPISNTMAEAWTMLRFIAPERLEQSLLTTFDQFAGAFGTVIQSFELTATGNFKAVERFAKFVNVQQLSELYRSHVDVILNDDVVEFKRDKTLPQLKSDAYTRIVIPQTEGVADELDNIKETLLWFEKLTGSEKRDNSHIPLVCFGQARKATLDIRLLDANNPDEPGSKCNQTVREILRIYYQTSDYSGTQLVFADTYQSPLTRTRRESGRSLAILTEEFSTETAQAEPIRFNLFTDLQRKLIEQGIPAEAVAIVPAEADKREPLFAKVRTGEVRVLLGTSERMGVGVNVQERLAAIHHLDAPNRPTDFEQRNGRIIRQGNRHAEWNLPIEVLTYGVDRTLDATAYGRLAIKQKFINQVLKGNVSDDQMADLNADDDFAAMSFDQMMATLSGSQYALMYTARQLELSRLIQQKKNWQRGLVEAQAQVERARQFLSRNEPLLPQLQTEADDLRERFGEPYTVTAVVVNGITYTEKWGEAVQHLTEQVKGRVKRHEERPAKTMQINGLTFTLTGERIQEAFGELPQILINYTSGRLLSGSVGSANGLFLSLKAAVVRALEEPAFLQQQLDRARLTEQEFSRKLSQPFRQESELQRLDAEVADLKRLMEAESSPAENNPGHLTPLPSAELICQEVS